MKLKVLKILREAKNYTSGQMLCEQLNISRTAVWKIINSLKEEGYEIDAIRNKGYKLISYPDILSKNELTSRIKTKWMGKNVIYFDDIDSTNAYAKRAAEEGVEDGTLVIADSQTLGRGRRGRCWESPQSTGIWMTIVLKPHIEPANASMLTLVMGLSTAKALNKVTGLDLQIKWPNDIIFNGKKICGILTEMSAQIDYINYVVIGTGINVNTESFPKDIADKAASLKIAVGHTLNRAELVTAILEEFEENYEKFLKTQNLSLLRESYNNILVNVEQQVRVLLPNHEYTGTAKGINDEGELIVIDEKNQKINYVNSGEVSVRGIYGYV